MGNGIVHFEVNSPNADKAQEFYSGLFGWHIDAGNPMKYGMVDTHGGGGINGGVGPSQSGDKLLTLYIEVESVDATLTTIEKAGGKTLMPETNVMDMVTIGMFADPEGHVIGLVKSDPSQGEGPGVSAGSGAPVVWWEIGARDGSAMQKWYADLFGWHVKADNPMNYGEVDTHASGINGGIFGIDTATMPIEPYVTFYVGVSDLQATLDKATSLGGAQITGPMEVSPDVTVAMFADPDGNMVGLLKQ